MSQASSNDTVALCLQKLMDSEVTEDCTHLLKWLAEYTPSNCSETLQIVEGLTKFWEKYGNLDAFNMDGRNFMFKVVQRQLLHSQQSSQVFLMLITLALKMLRWCDEALSPLKEQEMDLQPEVTSGIRKVFLEALMLSNSIYTNLEKCSFLTDKEFVGGVEAYTRQFLDSLKFFCLHVQKNQLNDEFQGTAQELLSVALKVLLKLRASFISACEEKSFELLHGAILERAHVVCYGVSAFMDLGQFAVANGRDWVGLLNIAWKGVTALLQTTVGREALSNLIDIPQIITTVMECTVESLKNAAEAWKVLLDENDNLTKAVELKRLCIPVKFFLINAIRITTNYPCQAVDAFRDVAACVLKVVALRHELSKHALLRFAAEAIVETVEPSLFILLHTLLISSELEFPFKLQLLEHLIGIENENLSSSTAGYSWETDEVKGAISAIFSGQEAFLQLGRLSIFLGLLQSCRECGEDISLELAKRLDFSLQMISDAKIYVEVFQLQVSATQSSTKATWQCLYITILKTLQVFFVALAGTDAWAEAEEFLFRNTLHPHALCHELVLEVWCFIARHCEVDMIEDHVQDLLLMLSDLVNSPNATGLDWPIRTLGRLICSLIKAAPDTLATKIYRLALGRDPFASPSTSVVAAALMREHFPISTLPGDLKRLLILSVKKTLSEMGSQVIKDPKEGTEHMAAKLLLVEETLCCLLELLIQETCEQFIQQEELYGLTKMTIDLLQVSPKTSNNKNYSSIRSHSLKIISRLWQKMQLSEIKSAVVALHDLVKNGLCENDVRQIKPVLAETLAGLGEVSLSEDEADPASCALWGLYHMILKERHWALAHLALTSFGYFAAHTSWNELWRFVPPDAALAFDARTGKLADEDSFMSSLRCFLEKEVARNTLISSRKDFKVLQQEGELQEKALLPFMHSQVKLHGLEPQELLYQGHMDVDPDVHIDSAESPLPPEIDQAMKMLQEGLSLLKEKLPVWLKGSGHSLEQQHQMDDQLSLLADVIAQLDVIQYNPSRPFLDAEGAG